MIEIQVGNPDLARVLEETRLFFTWDDFTRTWQLGKHANGNTWRSVMYLAKDRDEAEQQAAEHIFRYYRDR